MAALDRKRLSQRSRGQGFAADSLLIRSMSVMVHAQISVRGQVQGVGFRPFVFRLANELGLCGWVRNDGEGVQIAIEGGRQQVLKLYERIQSEPPQLARVENIRLDLAHPLTGIEGFRILASELGPVHTNIGPDIAICPDCLAELFDPENRRRLYPFINCIHCGPRYTITARLPYDRANTSMADFEQCPECRAEYDDPGNRRFHSQPNACPECGPQLRLYDERWQAIGGEPLAAAANLLKSGQIVAVKGIGGFHLVCDAANQDAVARLRGGKSRLQKPFAVMVLNRESARVRAVVSDDEAALLESSERPVVLLDKLAGCDDQLRQIAPGLSRIGLLLPYAPLHYLLFHELLGRPPGLQWLRQQSDAALVMTSANPGGEPLVKDDLEARNSLAELADAYLTHDRGIVNRCDDSVLQWQGAAPSFLRRARGFAPRRIALPRSGPQLLACGASLKNTVCLTRGAEAFVSTHIGDLDHAGTRSMLEQTVAHLCAILEIQPEAVAHDLHPDFYSTRFAEAYAAKHDLPIYPVQHHHAHIAAVCAEHGICEPVLGLALDGVGLGSDGAPWGGELLLVDGMRCERLGHLSKIAMPGGDRAAREPWRMAAAALDAMGRGDEIAWRFAAQPAARTMHSMLQRGLIATSSMGRLFDAAAALLGVCEIQGYEGQAAMQLEALAQTFGQVAALEDGYLLDRNLDFAPLLSRLADCRDPGYGAALFHATLCAALSKWVMQAASRNNLNQVALSGGCLHNRLLHHGIVGELTRAGLQVHLARQAPAGDGGISLGQAWVALQAHEGVQKCV